MKSLYLLLLGLCTFTIGVQAQVGSKNMSRMNVLLKVHGAEKVSAIIYEQSSGFIEQKVAGYTDHFTIGNIQRIIVRDVQDGSTVELSCDTNSPCINHIDPNHEGTYLSGVSYFF